MERRSKTREDVSVRTRMFKVFGLEPMAHRPPLVWRFWIYSATAYLMPVVVQIAFPYDPSSLDELVWLVTLVPAFILALHYGLRGAFVALIMGTALFVTVQLVLAVYYTTDDPRVTVPIFLAYGTLAISVGWLSEELHEHYELALELQAKQKTDALGNLAAGLGHEFNNILTAMVANAELMADDLPADASGGRDQLGRLKRAAQRGAGIVRNLLGLSRGGVLALRPIDLRGIVRDLRPRIRHLVPESVEIEVLGEEGLHAISADRKAVEEVLVSLVTNARDSMPGGGTIRIGMAPAKLGWDQLERRGWGDPGEYVCLSVSDTGAGMDENSLAHVFEPFFTTKDPGEGIGLGMAIVYGLVKQHRGFVDVESTPGRGTTVRVYFPVTKERVPAGKQEAPVRPPEGTETILVVEDEESIRRAAQNILERFGYSVEVASDGAEGLAAYEKSGDEVALVLCDVMLPELTGPELYEAIRVRSSPPKFLFMSGYPAVNLHKNASLDLSLPFLPKPWTVEQLMTAVRDVLDSGAPRPVG